MSYLVDVKGERAYESHSFAHIDFGKLQVTKSEADSINYQFEGNTYKFLSEENVVLIADQPYKLVTYFQINNLSDVVQPFVLMFPLIVTAILIISLTTAYLVSKGVTKPIMILNNKATAITNLDFDNDLHWTSQDEFGKLSNSLTVMQSKMKQVIDYIEEDSFMKNELNMEAQKQQLAILSHELNTPLTVLKMQNEMLLASATDEMSKMYIERNLIKVDEIEGLVDQILNFESAEFTHSIDVNEFVMEMAMNDYPQNLFKYDFNVKLDVETSPLYLKRLLNNLIGNSVKYNYNDSQITINTTKNTLQVINKYDPSINIDVDKILKPYVRANLDNRIKGEGLGLFICSRICALNGFKLEVFVRDGSFISQVIFKNSEESNETT